jgi:hypothetical protein
LRSVIFIALLAAGSAPAAAVASGATFIHQVAGATSPVRLTAEQRRPNTHAIYPTKPMLASKRGEDTQIIDHGVLIHYMTDVERERSRVVIVNGALFTSTGEPVRYGAERAILNYAMDAAGNFYILNQAGHPDLRHSSFFDGRAVACAGDVDVRDGRIVRINADSGHYSPSAMMFRNVLAELKKRGVDVSGLGR